MKYDVFISYSRKDINEVSALIETIRAEIPGLSIWFDLTGIESGDEFEEKIISAIDNSSYVLFALSDNALQSQWTKDEIMYAKNTDKKIVPILLKGASLKGWFLFKFGRVDCIDFSNPLQKEKLLKNLSDWTGKSRSHGTASTPKISDDSVTKKSAKSEEFPVKTPSRSVSQRTPQPEPLCPCGSGKLFKDCHGKSLSSVSKVAADNKPQTQDSGDFVLKVKGVEYPMVFVEGGTFKMGSDDSDAYDDEKPVHNVTLSSYCIGKYEVTQELWEAVMGTNPSYHLGARRPVERVSWNDCQEFIRKLNSLTGMNFKLPTEAQWEYAARGGRQGLGYNYSRNYTVNDVAWYVDNSGRQTHDVGKKSPNHLGLYDMLGNVWEWCRDWKGSYSHIPDTDPTGPSRGTNYVVRGGSYSNAVSYCRVSLRFSSYPSSQDWTIGFRLCL